MCSSCMQVFYCSAGGRSMYASEHKMSKTQQQYKKPKKIYILTVKTMKTNLQGEEMSKT